MRWVNLNKISLPLVAQYIIPSGVTRIFVMSAKVQIHAPTAKSRHGRHDLPTVRSQGLEAGFVTMAYIRSSLDG